MMWLARFKLFLISIAAVGTYDGRIISSIGHNGDGSSPDDAKLKNGNAPSGDRQERIRVPLGRRLADVVANDDRQSNNPSTTASRQYEIEADDDTTNGAKLLVEEVKRMAVTSKTTYSFHEGRNFNDDKIKDIAILASNPKEVEGITIMSINKSNGDVRGIQRGRTGHTKQISIDSKNQKLRLKKMVRSLGEVFPAKNWTCGAEHAHDDDPTRLRDHNNIFGEDQQHDHRDHHDHSQTFPLKGDFSRSSSSNFESPSRVSSGWIENPNPNYSFHVDISIDIDKYFIEKQGSAEAAVEYINVLLSAANVIFEHEVDAHLNIVHIRETDIFDNLTTTRDALKEMRLHPKTDIINGGSKIILHHAMLGRYLGGGIAFIDSICDEQWGYGVTSDISGSLNDLDELVLFDFFVVTHEIGHSLGSGHTFDAYDPPVDVCGACTIKPQGEERNSVTIEGLPRENSATLMSYCNFCDGGLSNIAITLGGVWDGAQPRTDIEHWGNNLDIVGSVSVEPKRVSHNIWQRLSSKGECVKPPLDPLPTKGCNDANDCDDGNICTIDVCNESNLCAISETLEYCCGNGKCEAGEGQSCSLDCGPFTIKAPSFCENCHTLDGFMVDVGLSDRAEKKILISSVSLAYASPENDNGATIDVYVSTEGSYIGKEKSLNDWVKVATATVLQYNPKRETGLVEIDLNRSIPLDIGNRRGLYFAASENIVKFGERPYSIRNDDEVELYSSLAVSGLFGDGINGFSLSCEVSYVLDDSSPATTSPSESAKSGRSINPLISGMASPPSANPVLAPPTSPPSNLQSEDDVQYTTTEEYLVSSSSPSSKPSEKVQLSAPATRAEASSGSTPQLLNRFNSIFAFLLIVYIGLQVD